MQRIYLVANVVHPQAVLTTDMCTQDCPARRAVTDPDATLDDIREAVRTLEDLERTIRRVFGGAHPFATGIVDALRLSRATLRAREDGKRVVFEYK